MKLIASLLLSTFMLLGSCAATKTDQIPDLVMEWTKENVWKVKISEDAHGSAFWLSDTFLLGACHTFPKKLRKNVEIKNNGRSLRVDVVLCDTKLDLALLFCENCKFKPKPTKILLEKPKIGQHVWGSGYGSTFGKNISHGYIQKQKDGDKKYYIASINTIQGESGGPVFIVVDNHITVIGMKLFIGVMVDKYKIDHYVHHLTGFITARAIIDRMKRDSKINIEIVK